MDYRGGSGTKAHADQPRALWRWRIARQWELSPGYAGNQLAYLTVGFILLVWL